MTKLAQIEEVLEQMETDEIVEIHNLYCQEIKAMDDYIYSMDSIADVLYGEDIQRVLLMVHNGHEFNPNDNYFYFNGYGNLESFSYHSDNSNSNIYTSEIARWIVKNEDSLGCDEIQDILEEEEEE